MKLFIPGLREAISFTEQPVRTLVVENQNYLFSVVSDFDSQLNHNNGKAVLSIDDKPVDMSKYLELITDFVRLDLNTKQLIGKICASIDSIAQNESHFEQTQQLLAQIENYLIDISSELKCNLSVEGISMLQLIKSSGISVDADSASVVEKVYAYLETVSEFLGEKLFVFVNMRSYVNDSDMQLFWNTVRSHNYKVLFLESVDRLRLIGEQRITVDNDLCEF